MRILLLTSILALGLVALPVGAQNLSDALVAYWPLNETAGDTAVDASGNGHDGNLMGDPEWADGYFGGALEFDGVGDEVNVPYDAALNPETFTVCAWANVQPGSAGAHRAVLASRDDFPQRGYIIYAEPGDTWQFWVGVGAGGVTWNSVQGPPVEAGEWSHLASVYADGTQKLYFNGEFIAESDADLNLNEAQVFLIGASANELDPHQFLFVGKIDDVRLYDRELSEDEIELVMASEATAVESSGKISTIWGSLKVN
jgi:hypothetical protein